jgi:putative endonuclease
MTERRPFITVYIMASGRNGTLYTGSTSDLNARVWQHKTHSFKGFSAEHGCTRLVWFEPFETMLTAIRRERRIKKWKRDWKLALIEGQNPA